MLLAASQMIAAAPPEIAEGLDEARAALALSSEGVAASGFSEMDRKYETQRSFNARCGKLAYGAKLRRR